MFYSQFILAKKGPLGTIWIAAHLERKLRKNQVADTDIGVSVDSILFPDVPIALRLSSHLLLGVVRIYSRKVNYLFDDCSEALLKIKQAFRSTAVDLPPEESTAPYHSITLPETFDLDDFELPDNDIFQGNYVDHHVSTREQITLQDTMEGVVYSTSQFGLDECFGDGDTSQVGLDLEEELLLDKAAVTEHNEISEYDAQASVGPMPHLETHACHESLTRYSEDMPLNGTINKSPDHMEDFEVVDYADAPSTPGLVEPNVSSVKEGLACDDHLELEEHNLSEMVGKTGNTTNDSDFNHREDAMELISSDTVHHGTLVCMPSENNYLSGELLIKQAAREGEFLSAAETTEQIPANESVGAPVELDNLEDTTEVVSWSNEQTVSSIDQMNGECEALEVRLQETDNVELGRDIKLLHSNGNATITIDIRSLEFSSAQKYSNVDDQDCQGLVDCDISNHDNNNEQTVCCSGFLRPCNSHLSQLNGSSPVNNSSVAAELHSVYAEPLSLNTGQREERHVLEKSSKVQEWHVPGGIQSEEIRTPEPTLIGQILEDRGKQDEQLDDVITKGKQREDFSVMTSECLAPEKLLFAPQRLFDEPRELLIETPERDVQEEGDGSEAGTKITGKKRSFTESSLTVQCLNSIDSFGVARSKGTVESIPEDDDLLSSILVGRKMSLLKMKPSPLAPEALPSKRARSASRPSALKRKVLMDDSMVLHGDTIRQQLTSTEDIRRLRKKAPCTHTEILMIQRQFLEDKIFNESIFTGMSAELTHLHNDAFDLSRVRVSENDDNILASFEMVDAKNSARQNVNGDSGKMEVGMDVVIFTDDTDGQPSEFPVQNGNWQVEDHLRSHDINFQDHRNITVEDTDFRSSIHDNLGELAEMEGYRVNFDVPAATNSTIMGVETLQCEPVFGEITEMPSDTVEQSAFAVDSMQTDTLDLSTDKVDICLIEATPFLKDTINIVGHDVIEAVNLSGERSVSDGTELKTEEEIQLKETKISASDEKVDGSAPNDNVDTSLANLSSFNDDCSNLNSVNAEQHLGDIENDKNSVHNEDMDLVRSSECICDKDQNPNPLCDDESKTGPMCSAGHEDDLKNSLVNHGDHLIGQDSHYQNAVETKNCLDQVTPGDCDEIQGAPFANDTEFLNVDNEELSDEDDGEGMPNTEEARLLENSGWSSRTRAVAKYLQTLFDKEAEHARKVISLDSLLAGKTRKEASRMFFETLVLKTRDYVQVEQLQPYDNLKIKPQLKLMISDF